MFSMTRGNYKVSTNNFKIYTVTILSNGYTEINHKYSSQLFNCCEVQYMINKLNNLK